MLFPCDGMDLERKEKTIRIPTYVHKNARIRAFSLLRS